VFRGGKGINVEREEGLNGRDHFRKFAFSQWLKFLFPFSG